VEVTVLMPCLNEAETVATCVRKAAGFLREHGIDGEIVVADNGSTDGSRRLAEEAGARVVPIPAPGYGNALMGGIVAAQGRYVIMGDADDSYDFTALMPFVSALRDGADLVMGNRFKGGIAPGAMPALHRYLGNPVLSSVGRLFFRAKIGDFHCGLRGFRRDSMLALGLQATGMEFASEMVVKSTLARQRVVEVPTTLAQDGRSHAPHLRSWRDGWRHLRFLLLFSPRWLFLIPGTAVLAIGLLIGIAVVPGPLVIGSVAFDVDTLVGASAMVVIGFQAVQFALFTKIYASAEGFLPRDRWATRVLRVWSLERGLVTGAVLGVAGVAGALVSISQWKVARFGPLDPGHSLRLMVPSATALVVSCQVIFGTFFMSILGIRRTRHPEAEALAGDGSRAPGASPRKAAQAGRPGAKPASQPKEPGESVGARSQVS
jgi:hypothetical protein